MTLFRSSMLPLAWKSRAARKPVSGIGSITRHHNQAPLDYGGDPDSILRLGFVQTMIDWGAIAATKRKAAEERRFRVAARRSVPYPGYRSR
jgi:hypothetical protein